MPHYARLVNAHYAEVDRRLRDRDGNTAVTDDRRTFRPVDDAHMLRPCPDNHGGHRYGHREGMGDACQTPSAYLPATFIAAKARSGSIEGEGWVWK